MPAPADPMAEAECDLAEIIAAAVAGALVGVAAQVVAASSVPAAASDWRVAASTWKWE